MNGKDAFRMFRQVSWIGRALFVILVGVSFADDLEVPLVDGHLGACATSVMVLDSENKPVYNAKITVEIRYGFMGVRRMSLEVGTNSEGKARVAGLPGKAKKPFEFEITSGRLSKKVQVDTTAKCDDSIQVKLVDQAMDIKTGSY